MYSRCEKVNNMSNANPENILILLQKNGPKTLTEIKKILGGDLPKPTILYHLKRLQEQGRVVRDGFKYSFFTNQNLSLIKIPCYGMAQAGVNARFSEDQIEYYVAVPPLFLHGYNPRDLFVMEVAGDSMEPTLHEHNLVLFKYYRDQIPTDNDIVLCKIGNAELKIKRFKNMKEYGLLCSDNYKKYLPIIMNEDSDKILGKMISLIN